MACWRWLIWQTGSARSETRRDCKENYAVSVSEIMPHRLARLTTSLLSSSTATHHLATRLLNQAPAWMPARTVPPAAGSTPATSNCAMLPCIRAPRRSRSGSACWPAAASPPGGMPWPAWPPLAREQQYGARHGPRPVRQAPGPGGRRAHQRPGGRRARRNHHRPAPVAGRPHRRRTPMLPGTAASKVTAAHLSRRALLYVRQSSLKQVIHNTESAIRQYDLRGKAVALGWDASQVSVIDIDQGQSGSSAADREGFQQLVAEVSLGRAGIVLGLECSRLARNNA